MSKPKSGEGKPVAKPEGQDRRKAIKAILAGGGAVATTLALPKEWTRPIVESIVVPAHATTSPELTTAPATTEATTVAPTTAAATTPP